MDEVISPTMTVKVAGHQWYWSSPYDLSSTSSSSFCGPSFLTTSSNNILVASLEPTFSILRYSAAIEPPTYRPLISSDIPIIPSDNHDKTLVVLNDALQSEIFSDLVRAFIIDNRGRTHDSYCYLTSTDGLVIPEGISLSEVGRLPLLNKQSGVYLICLEETGESYIGSAKDFASRLRSHRAFGTSSHSSTSSHALYSKIYSLGADSFTYTPLHPTTNFMEKFCVAHPSFNLTPKDVDLLDGFTKYEVALVEQAYLTRFEPSLNGRLFATTSTHPHLLTPVLSEIYASEPYIKVVQDPILPSPTIQVDISH